MKQDSYIDYLVRNKLTDKFLNLNSIYSVHNSSRISEEIIRVKMIKLRET